MTARFAAVLVLAALPLSCRGCLAPEAPTEKQVWKLKDPYRSVPPRGEVPDLERAALVIENAGRQLGYGEEPGRVLRLRRRELWAQRHVLLLAHGGTKQLAALHRDLVETWIQAAFVPDSVKFEMRLGEGRVNDIELQDPPEDVMRNAFLAEIAWSYYLLGPITPDGGQLPAAPQ